MILSIEGEEKGGKTTFAYTAPPPIVGFQFDMGIERALYGGKFDELYKDSDILVVPYTPEKPEAQWTGHDITVYEMPAPIQLNPRLITGSKELWNYFLALITKVFNDSQVRSIVIDTMTLARKIRCDTHLQTMQEDALTPSGAIKQGSVLRRQLSQIEYGVPNDSIRRIFMAASSTKKNLVAVHHLTDEYGELVGGDGRVTRGPTGNRVLSGLSDTYSYVDVAVRLLKRDKKISMLTKVVGYNLNLEGREVANPEWDTVVKMVAQANNGRTDIDWRKEPPADDE